MKFETFADALRQAGISETQIMGLKVARAMGWNLLAVDEREACARVCEEIAYRHQPGSEVQKALRECAQAIRDRCQDD